jgi:glucose-6-phosphate 1-dehydrogenase
VPKHPIVNQEPCILVIFGATGDLTKRKLYPALYNLYRDRALPEHFAVVAIGRRRKTDEEVRADIIQSIKEFSRTGLTGQEEDLGFLNCFHYFQLDFNESERYADLKAKLDELDKSCGTKGNGVFFLAVAPEHFGAITLQLRTHGMAPNQDSWQRLVIEKPFGWDLDSAQELNRVIRSTFAEKLIYRIDHYLGKEMVQNLMILRFANTLFEPLWNNKYIDHVQITFAETVGVEGRGPYYEQSGALRDMVQNHMLQLLTLIAMEPPVDLDTESIRDEKVKVLRSLRVDLADVVRGQYGPGVVNGQQVLAYNQEDRVDPNTNVETFVALKAYVENFRWAGVPFYMRTGKRMPTKYSEIVISFKKLPGVLYFKDEKLDPNLLLIRVQPDAGIFFKFNAKKPGTEQTIVPVSMDFSHASLEGFNSPEAYERLLYDVMRGESTLFTRWDEVEYSWYFVDQIAQYWQEENVKVITYPAGSFGPSQADFLIRADGREWHGY